MTIENSPEAPRTGADFIRYHIGKLGVSQGEAARTLGIDVRTMRRYCSGDLPVPNFVMMNVPRLAMMERNLQVIRMLDEGTLSTSDGPATRERLLENNEKLRKAIDYLVGRIDRFDIDDNRTD
jgi:hypothetical protein